MPRHFCSEKGKYSQAPRMCSFKTNGKQKNGKKLQYSTPLKSPRRIYDFSDCDPKNTLKKH